MQLIQVRWKSASSPLASRATAAAPWLCVVEAALLVGGLAYSQAVLGHDVGRTLLLQTPVHSFNLKCALANLDGTFPTQVIPSPCFPSTTQEVGPAFGHILMAFSRFRLGSLQGSL